MELDANTLMGQFEELSLSSWMSFFFFLNDGQGDVLQGDVHQRVKMMGKKKLICIQGDVLAAFFFGPSASIASSFISTNSCQYLDGSPFCSRLGRI